MKNAIPAKQVAKASQCSLRAAYYYLTGQKPWPPKVARAVERAFGVPRLHLLYPDEFDESGQRRQNTEEAPTHG